ncbi:hypothetical protein G8759_19800 [Spirosoma aureum]|uniref:Uncharacterized protein n=1 Tax=Spirosoma aureum TaxID=2692134 RepID=A0A6G9AQZ0_9BACT|nr:hypothetical protein [Spirosoma aureum]QIP14695.1 hypothetical protein G8759_19800 [Spirosoma aureum]
MLIGFKNRFHENDLAGVLIAASTGSNWIHTELIYPDGVSVSSWAQTKGVVARPTTETLRNPTYWEVYDLGRFDTAGLDAFIRSQIGRGYDWQGVFFTYGLPLQKQAWDKWTCAELVYFALVHYTPVDLPGTQTAVTPGQLRAMIKKAGYKRVI